MEKENKQEEINSITIGDFVVTSSTEPLSIVEETILRLIDKENKFVKKLGNKKNSYTG